jgi:hypothetical protein
MGAVEKVVRPLSEEWERKYIYEIYTEERNESPYDHWIADMHRDCVV